MGAPVSAVSRCRGPPSSHERGGSHAAPAGAWRRQRSPPRADHASREAGAGLGAWFNRGGSSGRGRPAGQWQGDLSLLPHTPAHCTHIQQLTSCLAAHARTACRADPLASPPCGHLPRASSPGGACRRVHLSRNAEAGHPNCDQDSCRRSPLLPARPPARRVAAPVNARL